MATDHQLEASIRAESNKALAHGAGYAALLSLVSLVPIATVAWTDRGFLPAVYFPLGTAIAALIVRSMAKREKMHSGLGGAIFVGVTFMPLMSLGLHALVADMGAATFFFGPLTYSWLIITGVSAFLFHQNLSRLIGILSAVLFMVGYFLARPYLDALPDMNHTFREGLRAPGVQLMKALTMVGMGFIAGALATTARAMIQKVRDEEREKISISALFGQYVSPEVREKLIREKAGVVGERKTVAVLFSDLRGFTTFSENAQPSEVVKRLNQYFDRMVSAVTTNGGTVDKFIGDAVMAVFGGLIPLENPAESALNAALAMRTELEKLNKEWGVQGLSPLDNGIGVHFGDVLQGPIGSNERKEFTVIGDVVNTASRLESATKELGAAVVVSEALAAALPASRRAGLKALGGVKLKGKEQQVTVFGAG
jgi:class 3 adenylate cyclase